MLPVGTRICVSSNVKGREVIDEDCYLGFQGITIGKSSPCSAALCLAMS